MWASPETVQCLYRLTCLATYSVDATLLRQHIEAQCRMNLKRPTLCAKRNADPLRRSMLTPNPLLSNKKNNGHLRMPYSKSP